MTGRPNRRPVERPDIERSARLATCLAGCTCVPDITIVEEAPCVYRAKVQHDTWCELLCRRAAPWS